MPLFSLVVPAYGCAGFLPKLFASLDAQTFRDFEVLIAVESDPSALAVAREYAASHPSVRVTELPVTGAAGASRNWCLENAVGEYLVPVDGDDWIDADALARLADEIEKHDRPEVITVSGRVFIDHGNDKLVEFGRVGNLPASDDGRVFDGVSLIRRIGQSGNHARNYAALTVCRRDYLLANKIRQLVGVASEDSEWVPRVWLSAKTILFLSEPYYNYRRRAGSVSSTTSSKMLYSVTIVFLSICRKLAEANVPGDVRRYLENDALSIFCWYMFNGLYKRRFSDEDRHAAFAMIYSSPENRELFRAVCHSGSFVKRLGLPWLMDLAAGLHVLWPAKLFFRGFYYPVSKLKIRRFRK